MIWRHGLHIGSAQHRSRPVHRNYEFAGERSSGNGFPSPDRLLQPLLPHLQEGWWSKTHSRSQTFESCPYETAVQNDHIETDPLTSITRGLVLFLLDLKDAYFHIQIAHHHMRFLRFAFERVAYPYTVLPFELSLAPRTFTKSRDAALCPLRQPGIHILNYFDEPGPVGGRASISQIHAPQPLRVQKTQGKFCQERAVPQPTNFIIGNSYRLSPNEGCGHARTCTGYSAAHGFIQTRSPSPPQSVSEDAGPHGLSIFGTLIGPASHAATSVPAKTLSSSTCLASQTPPYQSEPGLRCNNGPLEGPSVDGTGRAPGHGLQKE